MKIGIRMLLLLWLLGIAACAVPVTRPAPVAGTDVGTVAALPETEGWRRVQFRIARPQGEAPRWYIDALIGGEIVAPVYQHNQQDIPLWRIHRRAGNDAHGHVLSFIFYTSPPGAQRIYQDIRRNAVLADLLATGQVTWVGYDDLTQNDSPLVEDTSDPVWPEPIRKSWPALIMGASRMWLDLVTELAATHSDTADLVQRYELVQQDITRLWAEQGQHAVLHHLAALFAYQPLLIRY